MWFLVILASLAVVAAEAVGIGVAVSAICGELGMPFAPAVSICLTGLINLFLARRLFDAEDNDDEEGEDK